MMSPTERKPLQETSQVLKLPSENASEELPPNISIAWSLDPVTHSHSSSLVPKLRLTLTSHAPKPLTIYNDSLNPGRMLAEGNKFRIFDLTSDLEIQQRKARFCDLEPPSKVHVPLREHLFHTLWPETPHVLETDFGGGGKRSPDDARQLDAPSEPDAKPPARMRVRGVHGLEPDHGYVLRPGKGWGYIQWWEWGEKDEVMNPAGEKLDGRRMAYRRKSPHPGVHLDVENLPDIKFWCTE